MKIARYVFRIWLLAEFWRFILTPLNFSRLSYGRGILNYAFCAIVERLYHVGSIYSQHQIPIHYDLTPPYTKIHIES